MPTITSATRPISMARRPKLRSFALTSSSLAFPGSGFIGDLHRAWRAGQLRVQHELDPLGVRLAQAALPADLDDPEPNLDPGVALLLHGNAQVDLDRAEGELQGLALTYLHRLHEFGPQVLDHLR